MRVPAEDIRQFGQVVEGVEYRAERGWFDMPDHHAVKHLRSAGFGGRWHVPGVPGRHSGFTCPSCGFRGFFRTCGRCNSPATRTGESDA